VSDAVRQRYNIATGGGQSKPAPGPDARPAYAKGGQVKGVSHPSTPKGFTPTKKGC
jgi:hypothetical protein